MIRKTLAVAVILAAVVPANAADLMLGPVKLDPSYGFKTSYEDNIYRVPRDINHTAVAGGGVRGSWIFDNTLGLKVAAPVASNQKIEADYGVDFQNYATQSSANSAINQNADGSWSFKGSKTSAKVYDNYANTRDPQFNPNGGVINGALVSRQAHWNNTAGVEGEYYLGEKFFGGADYSDAVTRYLDHAGAPNSLADLLNSSVQTFGIKGGYQVAPKTRAFAAVHEALTHYSLNTRQDNHKDTDVDFGVEGDLTSKLKGLVQTGFIYQHYDKNSLVPAYARHWSGRAQLTYVPTDNDKLTLNSTRATVDSASGGYYVTTGATLAYDHKCTEKITAGVNGGVQFDKYSTNFASGATLLTRRDDTYSIGVKVDYQPLEWLKTGATFNNVDRYSTLSRQFSYRDNVTGVNAKVMF